MQFSSIELSKIDEKRGFIIPHNISEDLAEETGIHCGDGSMNHYKSYVYSLEGHIKDDREYYINHIKNLYKKLYNIDVRLRDRINAGVFGFQLGSKGLVTFKSCRLGLPLGIKSNIKIPEIIRKSNNKVLAAFIRGFFDTDGGIYLERKNNKLYPRIKINNNSEIIMSELKELLRDNFKFNLGFWKDNKSYVLVIRGENNFNKWMNLIGSNNPKNIRKYENWLTSQNQQTDNLKNINRSIINHNQCLGSSVRSEHLALNQKVAGSNPVRGTAFVFI